jgi:hypothetical protein
MEQSCYKCGQWVEEGVRFCPHCAAPQIRVMIAQPVAVASARTDVVAAHDDDARYPASQTVPVLAVPVQWSQAVKPCALAALVAIVLTFLRLYPLVAMLCVGFLAVVFYRQSLTGMAIKTGTGIRIGAFGGLLYFGIIALLITIAAIFPDARATLRNEGLAVPLQRYAALHPGDAQVQAVLEQMKTPEGFAVMLILVSILLLVTAILLGGVGGALAASILRRRDQT